MTALASSTTTTTTTGRETEILLPPRSVHNPIPSLSAALRVDNQEQFVQLLLSKHPTHKNDGTSSSQQILVFSNDSLRTVLMRQVLTDPHARDDKNKKKNWDDYNVFPNLPRNLNIIGTALLDETTIPIPTTSSTTSTIVTYFLKAHDDDWKQTLRVAQHIVQAKKRHPNNQSIYHHRIVYIPHIPAMIHKILEDVGLIGASSTSSSSSRHPNHPVSIHALPLDLFPIEPDVYTMEIDTVIRDVHVEGTPSPIIQDAARCVCKIQDIVGRIPRFQAYGPLAEEVLRKTFALTVEEYLLKTTTTNTTSSSPFATESPETISETALFSSGEVAALVIMDRKVDMITPLLTPLTYEGLLDEVIGIDGGFVHVDLKILNPDEAEAGETSTSSASSKTTKPPTTTQSPRIVSLPVNDSDSLYAEVRNQHVEKFGKFLQNQAMALRETHSNFTERGKKQELDELQKFVKQIPIFTKNLRSLTNHIHLAEVVKKYSEETWFREHWQLERSMLEGDKCLEPLEDLVAGQYPPHRFLRLLCLQSLAADGIQSSRYDSLRRDVVQTYGYEYLFVLTHLERAGLLKRREGIFGVMEKASPYNKLRDHLALIHAEVDTVEPDDISYVSSGYAPLTVRLIQYAAGGWSGGRDDILREIPGRFIDVLQPYPPEDLETTRKRPVTTGTTYGSLAVVPPPIVVARETKRKPVLMVMYLGGVTYMELAALRFLSKRQSFPYHIICITTKIINGGTFLQSLN
jgi:hypothetical protein